jgi:SAM-dependent methyltransferase
MMGTICSSPIQASPFFCKPMLTRNQKLLQDIDPAHQIGVEIGALANPIVTPDMGKIRYIDHDTTAAIKAKYANDPNVDNDKIVDVNYVWGEKSLAELTQAEAPFDYLIASHVIEHVPDLIGWLAEIRSILKPGGILSLAIPDKRQCFDYMRQNTRLSEVVEAYLRHSRRPSPSQIFDFVASTVVTDTGLWAWGGELPEGTQFKHGHSLADAWGLAERHFTDETYCDVHCWVFTPVSFFGLMEDLVKLDLLKFEFVRFHTTEGCEFFVSLRAVEQATEFAKPPELLATTETAGAIPAAAQSEAHFLQEQLEARIRAMESSKFWQLRTTWFKVKRKLGLPIK